MEYDDDIRRIATPLLSELLAYVNIKTINPAVFVPHNILTADFYHNIKIALFAKKPQILERWQSFLENSCLDSLSTHEMYIRYVMFACEFETKLSTNIFDELLSVFAVVVNFIIETLINSWVNFCELSVDIFMVFYIKVLRERFYVNGGFQRLAEYLRNNGNFSGKNYDVSGHEKSLFNPNFIKHTDVINSTSCFFLAKEVLFITKQKLPALPNPTVLEGRLQAARQQKAISNAVLSKCNTNTMPPQQVTTGETSERGSKRKVEETDWKQKGIEESPVPKPSENSTKFRAVSMEGMEEDKTHIEWIQRIAQTFTEYKNSKCTNPAHAGSRFHNEADKFLKQLAGMILSLADAL